MGQGATLAGISEGLGRIVVDPPLALPETIEAAEACQTSCDGGLGVLGLVEGAHVAAQFEG